MFLYARLVNRSYKDKRTEQLYQGHRHRSVPVEIAKRVIQKLFLIDTVTRLDDLRVPPGKQLEALTGDRAGQLSIRVNDQWRICFVWKEGDAYDVEFCDYH